jgi:glycosyltransferase involved in cell wall biosynthesis
VEHLPPDMKLHVLDDGSGEDDVLDLMQRMEKIDGLFEPAHDYAGDPEKVSMRSAGGKLFFHAYKKNLGRGATGNRGLRLLRNYDHIFACDDDVFPIHAGWMHAYMKAHNEFPQQQLLLYTSAGQGRLHKEHGERVLAMSAATGVFFSMTRFLITICGGWQTNTRWAFTEHEYFNRAHKAGLTPLGKTCIIRDAHKYLHAFDTDGSPWDFEWTHKSALTEEEKTIDAKLAEKNSCNETYVNFMDDPA